jgi:LacI family transcriptional regulator
VNDGYGFMVCTSLKNRGLKIPNDASVINFDNGQLSQISQPQITTMAIHLNLYGKKAVEQLLWRINNPNEPKQEILFPATLIKRESTGQCSKY